MKKIILFNKNKMNQIKRLEETQSYDASSKKDFFHKIVVTVESKLVKTKQEKMDKYCIFKLKKSRKIQNNLKRFKITRKTKKENFNIKNISTKTNQNKENFDFFPKAPQNTTQYLSQLHSVQNLNLKKNVQEKIRNNSKICLNDNKLIKNKKKLNFFYSNNSYFSNDTKSNSYNQIYSSYSDYKFINTEKESLNLKNYQKFTLENYQNDLFTENDYENIDFIDDLCLTGSSMKGLIESITKSKNKILSNSLILDEDESNNKNGYMNVKKTSNMEEMKNLKKDFSYKSENKISDFLPVLKNLQQNLMTDTKKSNDNFNLNLERYGSYQSSESGENEMIEFTENSTKICSIINSPFSSDSPICPDILNYQQEKLYDLNNEEFFKETNEYYQNFKDNIYEDFNLRKKSINWLDENESEFFLLGNKTKREEPKIISCEKDKV